MNQMIKGKEQKFVAGYWVLVELIPSARAERISKLKIKRNRMGK
jgi:hypothetical protein